MGTAELEILLSRLDDLVKVLAEIATLLRDELADERKDSLFNNWDN